MSRFTSNEIIRNNIELTNDIITNNTPFTIKAKYIVLYISKIIFEMSSMLYMDYFSNKKKNNINNLEITNEKNLFKQVYFNLNSILEDLIKFAVDADEEVSNSEYVNNIMDNIVFRINMTFNLIISDVEVYEE